jgi:hypothetical protein
MSISTSHFKGKHVQIVIFSEFHGQLDKKYQEEIAHHILHRYLSPDQQHTKTYLILEDSPNIEEKRVYEDSIITFLSQKLRENKRQAGPVHVYRLDFREVYHEKTACPDNSPLLLLCRLLRLHSLLYNAEFLKQTMQQKQEEKQLQELSSLKQSLFNNLSRDLGKTTFQDIHKAVTKYLLAAGASPRTEREQEAIWLVLQNSPYHRIQYNFVFNRDAFEKFQELIQRATQTTSTQTTSTQTTYKASSLAHADEEINLYLLHTFAAVLDVRFMHQIADILAEQKHSTSPVSIVVVVGTYHARNIGAFLSLLGFYSSR